MRGAACYPADSEEWDPKLRHLVEKFGPRRVYEVGLDVLSFPPTWGVAFQQVTAIRKAIEQQERLRKGH